MKKFIYIFILLTLFYSCCRKIECEKLTTEDLEWVPYIYEDQNLIFVNKEDSNDSVIYSIKIHPPKTQALNDFGQCDDVCGESIYVEYIYSIISFSIYRAYNQVGLNPSGSGSIPGDDYMRIGFNSGTFYKTFQTSYHLYNNVYKYEYYGDTIWYAKKYGMVKLYYYNHKKIYELKN